MKKKIAGQSIVETVLVILLVSTILSGFVVLFIYSFKTNRYAKNKSLAADYARQEIDEIKSRKHLSSFWEDWESSSGCCSSGSRNCYTASSLPSGFYCNLVCNSCDTAEEEKMASISVKIWWDVVTEPPDNKNKVSISTIISNWNQ